MSSRRALIICTAIALLGAQGTALAQRRQESSQVDDQTKKEASAHFKRGVDLFEEGLYRPALIEMRRAYELMPNYRVLYNIGQTHIALGEFVEAIGALDAFLVQGGSDVDEKRVQEVQASITQLRQRTATLAVETDKPDATVSLDGVALGRAPIERVVISVGRHRITAATEDGATASEDVDVAGGDHRALSLTLVEPVENVVQVAESAPLRAPPTGLSRQRRWSVGLLASAGAVGLGGMGMALMARSAHDDYDKARGVFPGDRSEIDDTRQRMTRTSLAADVMFGSAGALAVTGLVLWLTGGHKEEKPPAQAALQFGVGPHAVFARGRF